MEEDLKERGIQENTEKDSLRKKIMAVFPGEDASGKRISAEPKDMRTYSSLTLAYIGDAVYDMIIRTVVVERANRPASELHKIVVKYVSAPAQAKIIQALTDSLTQEEQAVYRRGKNAKPHTTAKNASHAEYMKATGFEAVLGYLYMTDNMARALELIDRGLALTGMKL